MTSGHGQRVLITACSSGIGLDAARHLSALGWHVIATCRRPEDIAARHAEGLDCLHLDLADPSSVTACVQQAVAGGPIVAVINNAAFALPGALEDMPRDALRAIFEVNVFGTHDLTRQMIAHFRQHGQGRIITISSVLGLVGIPWRGPYVGTKFALEGISDVLRLEMQDSPIRVILIEPGPITSKIRQNAVAHFERWVNWRASPRADAYRDRLIPRLYGPERQDRFELSPRAVSVKIAVALSAKHPAARYYVTTPTYISAWARRVLPTRALDWFARRS